MYISDNCRIGDNKIEFQGGNDFVRPSPRFF